MALTFGSLFAGIGGFELGLEAVGFECKWQVEIDPFASAVLNRHWADIPKFRDVRDFKPDKGLAVDVVCGGFPCQDISVAGKGEGLDGSRSGLWFEYERVVRVLRPKYVVVENVANIRKRGIERVLGSLASLGYDIEWQSFSASDFALPHRRKRILFVAYAHKVYGRKRSRLGSLKNGPPPVFRADGSERAKVRVEAPDRFSGVDDGVSKGSYSYRVSSYGNAVVPAAIEWVGRKIVEHYQRTCGGE